MKIQSYAILGLSRFGFRTAVSLFNAGNTVIAVDKNDKLISKIAPNVSKAICADLTDFELLEKLGILNVDIAIICMRHSFDVEVLLTTYIKKHTNVEKIIVQVDTDEKAMAIDLIGADMIVFPEKDRAERLVKQLTTPDLVEHFYLSNDTSLIELPVPQKFIYKTLIETRIRSNFNVYIIGIKKVNENGKILETIIAPAPDYKFEKMDRLLVLGKSKDIENFVEKTRN